ncbi:MAG: hypothetical protein CME61_02960 [Halobacteriovoraceae bacterium]|nr:hypothetical protein [Halobacteriovoraceae bacterium]
MGDFFIPGISKISSSRSEAANEFLGLNSGSKLSNNLKTLNKSESIGSEFENQLKDLIGIENLEIGKNEKSIIEKIVNNESNAHLSETSFSNVNYEVLEGETLRSTDQKVEKIKKELEQINNLLNKGPKVNLKSVVSTNSGNSQVKELLGDQLNGSGKNNNFLENSTKVTSSSARGNTLDIVDNNQFLDLRNKGISQIKLSGSSLSKGYEEGSLNTDSNIIEFSQKSDKLKTNVGINSSEVTVDSMNRGGIPLTSARPTFVVSESLAPQPLDLGSISTRNTNEILNEVVNYIERNRLENTSEFNMTVKHQELGNFKLGVRDLGGAKGIEIQIVTTTKEGSEFFNLNENNLFKVLTDKGLGVSSLKLSQSGDLGSGSEFSQESNLENGRFSKHNRDDQSSRDGKNKREQIWKAYQESLGA